MRQVDKVMRAQTRLYLAFLVSVVALGSLMKILVRNTRKRLYIATFRFVVLSELASRYEIESVLLARYGAANARKLLSRAK